MFSKADDKYLEYDVYLALIADIVKHANFPEFLNFIFPSSVSF